MALTTQAQEEDGVRIGREIFDKARGWNGWTLPKGATAVEVACARMNAVTQLSLKAVEADRVPMDGAIYGLGVSIGSMVATQEPATQRALLVALQNGLNRGNAEMRGMLAPKGRA